MDSTLLLRSTSPSELRVTKTRFNSNHFQSSSRLCKGLNIQNINTLSQQSRISSPTIHDLQNISAPRSLMSAPISQSTVPSQFLSESDSTTNWSFSASEESTGTTSLMTLGPSHSYPDTSSQLSNLNTVRSNASPATIRGNGKENLAHHVLTEDLSSVGITPYDTQFDSFHTWPHKLIGSEEFEIQDQLFSSISSPGILYEEPEILKSSGYSRSSSSSPSRFQLGAEQRELKRQQDQARRESKSCLRRARSTSSNSNHYNISQRTSPDLLPQSEFATSVTQSPLLSQCSIQNSPALSSTPFLPSYSPQITGQVPSDIYGPTFTIPGDFTSAMSYPLPYSNQAEAPVTSFLDRSHNFTATSIPENLGVYCPPPAGTRIGPNESNETVRVVHSRPKPQCWEHGCNGRQFSTFSNLLRHQREKSGAAQKSSCPHCGAEFTRTTARNGHLAHDKCKQRRST